MRIMVVEGFNVNPRSKHGASMRKACR